MSSSHSATTRSATTRSATTRSVATRSATTGPAANSVQLWSFGAPTILVDNQPVDGLPAKGLALLTYLALTQKNLSRMAVAHLLWSGVTEDKALANLRKVIQPLRAALPNHLLVERHSVALSPEYPIWVDALAFKDELAHAIANNHPTQIEQVLERYSADFLADFYVRNASDFEAWQAAQQAILREKRIAALKQLCQLYIEGNELSKATSAMRQVLTHEPWREEVHRQLMRLLFENGETAQALLQYERCCQLLDDELGVPPSAATQQLYAQIRAGKVEPAEPSQERQRRAASAIRVSSDASSGFAIPRNLDLRVDFRASKELFGIDTVHGTLLDRLRPHSRPWLVAIDGIGGIGKTALAQSLLTELSQSSYFERMAWINARREEFEADRDTQVANSTICTGETYTEYSSQNKEGPENEEGATPGTIGSEQLVDSLLAQLTDSSSIPMATHGRASTPAEKETLLRRMLAEKPTLVVIDNLETVADYMALLPALRGLANPSKFLLTSRHSLAQHGDVFSQTLKELNEEDVFGLLRHEATMRGLAGLATADDDTLAQIYAVVGGHPLALNLILGQLNFLPIDHVLNGLQQQSNQRVEELYAHIYWQTWQLLDVPARQLLCIMPMLHNASYEQLAAITDLPAAILQTAITQLIGLSLLNMNGDLFEPRYALHRLTETFLANILLQKGSEEPSSQREALRQGEQYQGGQHRGETRQGETRQGETRIVLPPRWQTIYVQAILNGLEYWTHHEALTEVNVEQLDRSRESILNLLEHGLRYEATWPQTWKLIVGLASYMERRGHWRTWRTILERAVEMAQNTNDIDGEIATTSLLGRLSIRQGRHDQVIYNFRRVLLLAKAQNNQLAVARAYSNLGYVYIDSGHWWRSERLNLRALEILEELESKQGVAHTCNHLGLLYTRMEQWDKAQAYLEKACRLWSNSEDQHGLFAGQLNLGLMYVEMNATAEAMVCLQIAHSIAQRTGELSNTARIWNNMAVAHYKNAAWAEAEECAKKAESLFQEYADERGLASAWENIGTIYADMNRSQRAAEYFGNALVIHRKFNNQPDIERIHTAISIL